MPSVSIVDEYMVPLLAGNRTACRNFVLQQVKILGDPLRVYFDLLWPAMERVDKLFRADRINTVCEHMATRIIRAIADQLQMSLPQSQANGKRIVITSAEGEPEELGAQMCADLFESRGWDVYFVGGGVPNDEILTLLGQLTPDILLIFGTQPQGVPGVRKLIDTIREIGINPSMNVMVSGGVFSRADGLWKEVNADLFARSADQALVMTEKAAPRAAQPPQPGAPKRRRRRKRASVAAGAIG
jgi:methanogenic corrinoid protein MtbC1